MIRTEEAAYPPYYELAVHPEGDIFALLRSDTLLHSTDQGETWTIRSFGGGNDSAPAARHVGKREASTRTSQFITYPDLFTISAQGTLLRGADGGIDRSTDKGATWTRIQEGLPPEYVVAVGAGPDGALAVTWHPESWEATAYYSSDDGVTWTRADTLGSILFPDRISVASAPSDAWYVTTGDQLLQLRREGNGWQVHAPIPEISRVLDLTVDATGTLYLAGDDFSGEYAVVRATVDAEGQWRWEPFAAGLSDVSTIQVLTQDAEGYLYLGTERQGVYRSTQPVPTATPPPPQLPSAAPLGAAYPNPFQQRTTIPVTLAAPARISVTVYDLLGRKVAAPVREAAWPAGTHDIPWNAAGQGAGVYVVKLIAGGRVETQQVVLIK